MKLNLNYIEVVASSIKKAKIDNNILYVNWIEVMQLARPASHPGCVMQSSGIALTSKKLTFGAVDVCIFLVHGAVFWSLDAVEISPAWFGIHQVSGFTCRDRQGNVRLHRFRAVRRDYGQVLGLLHYSLEGALRVAHLEARLW
jgi:hypothetical protein